MHATAQRSACPSDWRRAAGRLFERVSSGLAGARRQRRPASPAPVEAAFAAATEALRTHPGFDAISASHDPQGGAVQIEVAAPRAAHAGERALCALAVKTAVRRATAIGPARVAFCASPGTEAAGAPATCG